MSVGDGGGFVPPGIDANAGAAEGARRVGESARVRITRDMVYGSRAQMRSSRVTKV